MNIFKFDSPVMQLIGKIADFIILNILTLILSIPIVTFGAAYTAKYYVSMKIVRGEEGTLFKSYFKSFKENFKQSTIVWLIQLALLILLGIDWIWIYNKGFGNVNAFYLAGVALLTGLVVFTTATIFPFIARFELTIKEAFKGAILFSILYYIKLLLIAALEVITVLACIWYAEWLPAFGLFGTTTAFYFMNLTLIKGFSKLEKKLEKEEAEKEAEKAAMEEKAAEGAEEEEVESIVLRPDEHTLKGKIEAEKQTFKSLTFKEKLQFIKDYYLLKAIIGICVAIFVCWFFYDAFLSNKEILYSGGLLYCTVTEEGTEYMTTGFFDKVATNKRKQEVKIDDSLTMNFVDNPNRELKPDPVQDQNLFPYMVAGYYDYFMIDAKFIDHYMELEDFKDISEFADKYEISEEDRFVSETGEVYAIKLPEEICEKTGIYSVTGEGVYLALIINKKDVSMDEAFMEYLFE